MKLNTKLVMIMLTMLVVATLILFVLNQFSQNDLVQEIQESSTVVSKAIQLSVEDLTSEEESTRLSEYLSQAKNKGVNEINIINNEGEIINSSDPAQVGKKREIKKLEKGLKRRGSGSGSSLKPYDLVVPVIVGDEQLGYVQINLLLDNIRDIQHANFVRRLSATVLVFMGGMILIIFLARRYTSPIHRLATGVNNVSAGDLSVTFEVESGDEIGELAENLNEMVKKLKEKEQLEKRLYEAEHLSKVGQLAAGIAHEIRNPLNYISLAIDHLKSELLPSCPEKGGELESIADNIKEEVRKANYMVLNFMNYGRPLKLKLQRVNYADLLDKAIHIMQDRLTERNMKVVREIPADLPAMQIDPELMRNCLCNFISNSMQAMSDGGTITLGAAVDPETGECRLSFSDCGVGIDEQDLEKVFQPYFTTREAGIGLGLAITERIVKEHGGRICVESRKGEGTTFIVILPAGAIAAAAGEADGRQLAL
ncbi:HAMP domain-containing sensor histidine kinase [Geomonas azotofigens]|uniref:HAMP domain-containing sensor histidine kinase n=1 Tax=Geomonas azotofigens TaxID=2843196 RepID=UPI001C12043E|nr:HAMP domain-containing sensor histidine kinase [Geomonas azotofigens]MBU5611559.1 HAMP domain-containing protein [Geomonas azotofigens]